MSPYFKRKPTDGIRRRPGSGPASVSSTRSKKIFLEPEEESISHKEVLTPPEPESGFIITEEEPVFRNEEVFPAPRRYLPSRWRWGVGSAGAGALVMVILLTTVFARITLIVKPRVEIVDLQDVTAALDTSISRPLIPQKVIPAEQLEFSRKAQGEFESTGRQFIEEKASGKVKIFNSFSSTAQTLVEGTRLVTDSGVLFRLVKTTVIPGAKIEEGKIVPEFIEAELQADKSGDQSNISGEVALKIPGFKGTAKYQGFYARAPSGFSGGFKGEARVVSKDDLKKAEEGVTKEVFDELRGEIARKIPPDFKLLDALREIQITSLDAPRANTRRDKFSVEAGAAGRILIFRESDAVALVKELVLKNNSAKELVDNSATLNYEIHNADFGKKKAVVSVRGSLKIKSVIPREEIINLVRGKKEGSILEILKGRSELATFKVAFFPPWLFTAPANTAKIRLIVQNP